MAIKYTTPASWIKYDFSAIQEEFVEAKTAIMTLKNYPHQREWVENLQELELKREVAGTSRIEGAEFTERELDEALKETPTQLYTRSQRQAHAAVKTYRWIATIPDDKHIDADLIKEIHRQIVTNADDDHCPPGVLRGQDQNVTFGIPRHRGVTGGQDCSQAFERFTNSLAREYQNHDPIIQAMTAHYHFAAMHPFLDGNGRTARALEALMLQRAGLRNTCFIAMSNYYHDEKNTYLDLLAQTRAKDHDLTLFLAFTLKGLSLQVNRMLNELRTHVQKALFRNVMFDMFKHLKSPKKRFLAERQLETLKLLLREDRLGYLTVFDKIDLCYQSLKHPESAFLRDIIGLADLGAIRLELQGDSLKDVYLELNLDWPTEITENDFMERIKKLPKAKTTKFFP